MAELEPIPNRRLLGSLAGLADIRMTVRVRPLTLTKLTFGHSAATVDSCRPLSRAINGRYVVGSGLSGFG